MATNSRRSYDKADQVVSSARAKPEHGVFFDDVKALLGRVTHLHDEDVAALRQRIESSLSSARSAVESGGRKIAESTTGAAKVTDDFVHSNPWKAIGVAAVACLALGTLLHRR